MLIEIENLDSKNINWKTQGTALERRKTHSKVRKCGKST